GKVRRNLLEEAAIQLNEQPQKEPHLRGVEEWGCMLEDTVEASQSRLAQFLATGLLGLALLLLTIVFGFALLFPALLFGLVLGHPLRGSFLCLLVGSGRQVRRRVGGFTLRVIGMHRAIVVEADRHRVANV